MPSVIPAVHMREFPVQENPEIMQVAHLVK